MTEEKKSAFLYFGMVMLISAWIWFLRGETKTPRDVGSSFEEISITDPSGQDIWFRIPDGYTPYAQKKMELGSRAIKVRAWAPDLGAYYPAFAKLKALHNGVRSEYLPEERQRKVEIEIRAHNQNFLRQHKDMYVLPEEVDRNFPVLFGELLFLGHSTRNSELNPGKRYRRHTELGVIEFTSPYFWYVPVNEGDHPGSHISCTRIRFEPHPRGVCTAYRELTASTYLKYHFPAQYIREWTIFDERLFQLVSSFLSNPASTGLNQ